MITVIMLIWQLPQFLLGLLLIKITGAKKTETCGITWYRFDKNKNWFNKFLSGASLVFIILPYEILETIQHENGHCKQSEILGLLYLVLIGLPSAIGNLLARVFVAVRKNYYKLPWEAWADKLGGVKRQSP